MEELLEFLFKEHPAQTIGGIVVVVLIMIFIGNLQLSPGMTSALRVGVVAFAGYFAYMKFQQRGDFVELYD